MFDTNSTNFLWTDFYSEFATSLLKFANDRVTLIKKIQEIYVNINMKLPTLEKDNNIIDIDPFTIFGLFNKGITNENRIAIIKQVKVLFNIASSVPTSFDGIPVLNNMSATFYYFSGDRGEKDIDNLWNLFSCAISYADEQNNEADFIKAFNTVIAQKGVSWNITMGLYWIRPFTFINLDARNRKLLENNQNRFVSGFDVVKMFKRMVYAENYLTLIKMIKETLNEYSSFPELSFEAWKTSFKDIDLTAKEQELLNQKVNLCWYVGAFISSEDKTEEFIDKGIWINEAVNKYHDVVSSMNVGDKIAIKSTYTQKHNLPFNINGGTASVMEIKAVGTVTNNHKDGRTVDVEWIKLSPSKKWYFYTMRSTIWKVDRTDYDSYNNALLEFTFEDKPQIYKDFLTHPSWAEKYLINEDGKATYLSEIIVSLKELGGMASLNEITNQMESRDILPYIKTNKAWKRNVSAEIQKHCSETKSYIEGNDDLFYSVDGVGKGIWGLVDYNPEENELEIEVPTIIPYTKSNFLNDVYITSTEYDKLYNLLKYKKNIILQGAPGVGKTFAAKRLAYSIIGEKDDSRVQCVQFHQSYSYEDFIEGFRPLENGGFELHEGVFKKFCDKASRNSEKDFFFIIDEINRGNMSKIFGELLMLIEADKRGNNHSLNLVYSGKPFSVPENLYIIGMMNTADRSLAMIDYALRRRFSFYTMKPAFESEGFKKHAEQVNCELFHKAVEVVKNLNTVIVDDKSLGKGFEIGHSYFCTDKPKSITDETIRNIVAFEIIPTIEEYWFDNETRLDTERQKLEALLGDDNGAV